MNTPPSTPPHPKPGEKHADPTPPPIEAIGARPRQSDRAELHPKALVSAQLDSVLSPSGCPAPGKPPTVTTVELNVTIHTVQIPKSRSQAVIIWTLSQSREFGFECSAKICFVCHDVDGGKSEQLAAVIFVSQEVSECESGSSVPDLRIASTIAGPAWIKLVILHRRSLYTIPCLLRPPGHGIPHVNRLAKFLRPCPRFDCCYTVWLNFKLYPPQPFACNGP